MRGLHQPRQFIGRDQSNVPGATPPNDHHFLILHHLIQDQCEPGTQARICCLCCQTTSALSVQLFCTRRTKRRDYSLKIADTAARGSMPKASETVARAPRNVRTRQ
jgi:hypothetical protein